ncbi:MAG: hypothetical protein HC811_09565 [Flammeovirgaceae bacterium]|nr:hypothetical protein [Flammeovirgaceae bacterium]
MKTKVYKNIASYIADFPKDVAGKLTNIRECIQKAAPGAQETIGYNMPAFKQGKVLVYFAAFKNHIGLYALPSGNLAFKKELSKYKTGKGSIQFQLDEPIPYSLIKKIVRFRVKEIEK